MKSIFILFGSLVLLAVDCHGKCINMIYKTDKSIKHDLMQDVASKVGMIESSLLPGYSSHE